MLFHDVGCLLLRGTVGAPKTPCRESDERNRKRRASLNSPGRNAAQVPQVLWKGIIREAACVILDRLRAKWPTMAPSNGTPPWHPTTPSNGTQHPAMAPYHGSPPWHPTMAGSQGMGQGMSPSLTETASRSERLTLWRWLCTCLQVTIEGTRPEDPVGVGVWDLHSLKLTL